MIFNIIDEIFDLYEKYGSQNYIGEEITQIEHMIQSAMIAESESNDTEFILSAFLHDIGHLLGDKNKLEQMGHWGTENHDKIAENYLRDNGFPEKVCKLVGNHVNAKRYLVSIDKEYYDNLSKASKMTLKYQGGIMSETEIDEFKNDPLFPLYIKLRYCDERAKEKNIKLESIEKYKNLMLSVLTNHHYLFFNVY